MVEVERARGAAVRMGALDAAFRTDTLRGVDAVIDAPAGGYRFEQR